MIALGHAAAGDDGVGAAILDELRRRGVAPDVELLAAADVAALTHLLETPAVVVLVDAALARDAGRVLDVDIEELSRCGAQPCSSHGLDVGQVVALARLLAPSRVARSIRLVAVTIERAQRFCIGLSPPVAAAVPAAADRIASLLAPPSR